jgi:membrane fusion protein (multidrug efflux system)
MSPSLSPRRGTVSALAVLLGLALAACGGGTETPAADAAAVPDTAIPVEVLVAAPTLFEDVIALTGNVAAPEDAVLNPEASGTLTYLAPLGAYVGRGATVAQVDPSLAQAGVAQAQAGVAAAEAQKRAAEAQLELAEDTYRRQEPLYRDSILSAWEFRGTQTQLAAARAGVAQTDAGIAQARAALRQAQTALGNTRIVAPFGGTVEAHLANRGELVSPATPVVRVVSGGVQVEAGVPERYAADIELGTPVRVIPSAYDGEALGGRVTFVGRAVDPQSRTFPIEVALGGAEVPLRPEMVVRLEVSRAVLEGVIALPLGAIVRDERGASVYVVREDTTGAGGLVAARQPVVLGPTAGSSVVISSGLEPGARVIATGQSTVTEGDRVRVVETRRADDVAANALSNE